MRPVVVVHSTPGSMNPINVSWTVFLSAVEPTGNNQNLTVRSRDIACCVEDNGIKRCDREFNVYSSRGELAT